MMFRVYKSLRGFIDVEAESYDEAYELANEASLNSYEFTEEETTIDFASKESE